MGCYLNPGNGVDKREFLEDYGLAVVPHWPPRNQHVYLCLIDNGAFCAAEIAYDEKEFSEFAAPRDPRIKIWYELPIEKLWGNMYDYEEKRLRDIWQLKRPNDNE